MDNLTEYIKKQYASQAEAELAGLKDAYEKNSAAYERQLSDLPAQYEAQRNAAAAQNALARRTFNERAAATGLNTGTAGQAELARSAALQSALAGIRTAESNAARELERGQLDLAAEYQNAIAAARAKNEAAMNEALYNELVRQQQMAQTARAQKAAESGSPTPAAVSLLIAEQVKKKLQRLLNERTKSGVKVSGTMGNQTAALLASYGYVSPEDAYEGLIRSGQTPAQTGYGSNDIYVSGLGTFGADDVLEMVKRGKIEYNPATGNYQVKSNLARDYIARMTR